MKIAGYIITVLGVLALIGTIVGGHSPIGPIIWIALGVFLIIRANNKQDDKEKFDQWNKPN